LTIEHEQADRPAAFLAGKLAPTDEVILRDPIPPGVAGPLPETRFKRRSLLA
jgi:hypothetical protein